MKNVYLYKSQDGNYVAAQDDENRFHWAPCLPEFRTIATADKNGMYRFVETKTENGWEFAGRLIFNK